jgi:hypothetical protein
MTFTDLQTRVTYPFGGNYATEALNFLSDAQADISVFARCYEKSWTTVVDDNLRKYIPLPNNFIQLKTAPVYGSDVLIQYGSEDLGSRYNASHEISTGTPVYYRIEGGRMEIIPYPTAAKKLTFVYYAVAEKLNPAETHKKLDYDGLKSKSFHIGDTIKGETTSVTAIVDDNQYFGDGRGTLTVRDITLSGSYTGFQNDENINVIDSLSDSYEIDSPYGFGYTFAEILTNWDDLGLGGQAVVRGTDYDENIESGVSPVVPTAFHHLLVDYAQAKLYEMLGQSADADRCFNRYYNNRERAASVYFGGQFGGPMQVADVMY